MQWWLVGDGTALAEIVVAAQHLQWPQPQRFDSAESALADGAPLPTLVVTDWLLPGASGIHIARMLRRRVPRPRVLLAGTAVHPNTQYPNTVHPVVLIRAREAGVRGCIALPAVARDVRLALQAVRQGRVVIDRRAAAAINVSGADDLTHRLRRLVPREFEVLWLAARGHSSAAIGRCLRLRASTVERHLASAMRRTGLTDTASLPDLAALLQGGSILRSPP